MNNTQQETLRALFHRGLSMLGDNSTVDEWRDLIWELQRAVRSHIAELNAATEMKAVEGLTDAEKAARAASSARMQAGLGI